MNWLLWLKSVQIRFQSKPANERQLYRLIYKHRCERIVEFGIARLSRSRRIIQMAQLATGSPMIDYTAIDLFDARRNDQPSLPLKQAHQQLTGSGAQVHLVPGGATESLQRVANSLANTDLILLSSAEFSTDHTHAWFYLPRMLHANSLVVREVGEENDSSRFERIANDRLQRHADGVAQSRRAA